MFFSIVKFNILTSYRCYDYKIQLELGKYLDHRLIYDISREKDELLLNKYLKDNFCKSFIYTSISFAASPVLFIKKIERELRYYIDCQRLNSITVKDRYLIFLI